MDVRGTGESHSESEQTLAATRANKLAQASTVSNSRLPEAIRQRDRISVKVQDQAGEARNRKRSNSQTDTNHHRGWRVGRLKIPHDDFVTYRSPADLAAQFDRQPAPREQAEFVRHDQRSAIAQRDEPNSDRSSVEWSF